MVGHAVTPSVLVPKLIHIILEYCEGGNLNELAIKEPYKMTENYVLHLAEQVAKGIRYLHTRDPVIVYGDLKGENILFHDTAFMQVKIADLDSFGMFKGSQTLHGLMKNPAGSPTHMSPEMLTICDKLNSLSNMDERVGRRTDMYSFACLILELINKGEVPYTDKNKLSIAQNELSSLLAIRNVIHKGGSPDVSILFSAPNALRYSRELQTLLNQCLLWNPAERPDCHDLLARVSYLRTDQKRSHSDAETQTETGTVSLEDPRVKSEDSGNSLTAKKLILSETRAGGDNRATNEMYISETFTQAASSGQPKIQQPVNDSNSSASAPIDHGSNVSNFQNWDDVAHHKAAANHRMDSQNPYNTCHWTPLFQNPLPEMPIDESHPVRVHAASFSVDHVFIDVRVIKHMEGLDWRKNVIIAYALTSPPSQWYETEAKFRAPFEESSNTSANLTNASHPKALSDLYRASFQVPSDASFVCFIAEYQFGVGPRALKRFVDDNHRVGYIMENPSART
ncbi:hypothetical protein BV898_18649 [Hypsibius exemplaris]|uniref:non-specific serine/threonine protein kinase n=1 Tax=Hypsibius exemplaris TaxID=2072580 RepID=A0A9X6NJS1_HYPEX|nr:hypothetical protein BV898_18649 [Hypsibius exemplaris]